jgi:hypothetical protein
MSSEMVSREEKRRDEFMRFGSLPLNKKAVCHLLCVNAF